MAVVHRREQSIARGPTICHPSLGGMCDSKHTSNDSQDYFGGRYVQVDLEYSLMTMNRRERVVQRFD
jgi:hypothetical protein